MKQKKFNREVSTSMNRAFAQALQNRLMDEQRPFEMRMRFVVNGIWNVEIHTDEANYSYFKSLLNERTNK